MIENAIAPPDPESNDGGITMELQRPESIMAESLSTGAWIVIFLIVFIVLLMIVGIVIENTNIGNKPGVDISQSKPEEAKQKWALLLYSFNPVVNLRKLFHVKEGGDKRLAVLNGVRVLSIGWVILGHGFGFVFLGPVTNITTAMNMFHDTFFGIIPGGFFAVDTFFFLSGFLTFAIMTQKLYAKGGWVGGKNTFLIYFHRYYRLIFPIIFLTLLATFLTRYLGGGPIFRQTMDTAAKPCRKYWWANFLFINNFYPTNMNDQCIGWVWYLANDFQMFLISPFVILAYCKGRMLGYLVVLSLVLVTVIVSGSMTLAYDIGIDMASPNIDGMTWLYEKPWGRTGPYFIGALFGLSYFELSCKEKYPELGSSVMNKIYESFQKSRILSIVAAAFGIGLTALYVFPNRDYYINCAAAPGQEGFPSTCWSVGLKFIYNATSRTFFTFGLGLILMPTFVGRLRVIKHFLGADIFVVLGRLNYMVYMIH